jgi:ketosteroid isomerase-like protein
MSQENVEVVRKAIAYEYYGVGDRAEAEAIFDPQVVLNPIDEGPSSGFDAMRADMERWASAFDELKVTVEEIIDAGDQVVVVAHHQGRGRQSGVEVDTRFYELYTLREGKVARMDEYTERAEALEAAGLRE